MYYGLHKKIWSSTTIFNIDHNNIFFKSVALAWYLNDQVTLRAEVMGLKTHKLHLKYIKTENTYFKLFYL